MRPPARSSVRDAMPRGMRPLDKAQRRAIFERSLDEQLERILMAAEALRRGVEPQTQRARLRRAFHTIKSDAAAVGRDDVARLSGHIERAAEAAHSFNDFPLDLELVDEAASELRAVLSDPEHRAPTDFARRAGSLGRRARTRLKSGGLRPA